MKFHQMIKVWLIEEWMEKINYKRQNNHHRYTILMQRGHSGRKHSSEKILVATAFHLPKFYVLVHFLLTPAGEVGDRSPPCRVEETVQKS